MNNTNSQRTCEEKMTFLLENESKGEVRNVFKAYEVEQDFF